jgi:glycosyltransferase involved in cell wall biosynthesis
MGLTGARLSIALFHNLPSGGAKRHTMEQVRELSRRGHRVVEFVPSTADIGYCDFAPYVEEQRVYDAPEPRVLPWRLPLVTPYVHALQGLAALRATDALNARIAAEIDAGGFDLVLAKDCTIAVNPFLLRHSRTPTAYQLHHGLRHEVEGDKPALNGAAAPASRLKHAYYAPARRIFRSRRHAAEVGNVRAASRVLTNSAFSRGLIARHYDVDAAVVYPGINTDVFHPEPVPEASYVLSVGALVYSKGHRFVVRAVGRLPADRRPPLRILANSRQPTEEAAVRALAAELAVDLTIDTVTDESELRRTYAAARLFLYAPIQEALGLAPLEAMACGTPVLAVDEGGVRETVRHRETGWLVARDEAAFADELLALLADSGRRERAGRAGSEHVRQDWSWAQAVDRLEAELRAVAAR